MIEEEVEEEVAVADFHAVLAAHEGEAAAEFEQEFFEVAQEAGFEFPLVERFFQCEEIEEIRVLQQALGDGGVGLWQGGGEVGDGSAQTLVGVVFDLEREGVAGPALFEGLAGIPAAGGEIFELLDEDHMVKPREAKEDFGGQGQLCRSLRHNCNRRRIRAFQFCSRLLQNGWGTILTGKSDHVTDIPSRKPLLLGQFVFQIRRQPGDDARAPASLLLAGGDHATDVPIREDHLGIGGESGAMLGLTDAGLDVAKEVAVEGEFFPFSSAERLLEFLFQRWH